MITNKELNEVNLSPTKKDYYQIWNELMELADKISDRWSPATTNESDPGIVLLKALTAVADKLNYNIDKNTLEAFMPSATQEDSMRKLTEMMGYNMKYYQSAICKVNIAYKSTNDRSISTFGEGIFFPKFTNLKNEEEEINYVTLEDFRLQGGADSREVLAIEGEMLECESDNDNIISMIHLDDSNRYMLPEYTIAENGIFITNVSDTAESEPWHKTNNLNTQLPGSKVYKFGFDSQLKLPYVQFPADIGNILGDGLRIKYIRSNGLSGNISAGTLCKLEKPSIWATAEDGSPIRELTADMFTVSNSSAASNGADPETLTAAYNNYKKTIGTFDTLVTCRDYMNRIYQMTESDTNTTPLVSNIIVSDIRDDINRAVPICSFNEYGICYSDRSKQTEQKKQVTLENGNTGDLVVKTNKIEHFDLVLYPFKTVYGLNNENEFKNSFKYTAENMFKIKADLDDNKVFAHNLTLPEKPIDNEEGGEKEIVCIKNYMRLKAKVSTTKKVTILEESEILKNIYKAIYKNFNARQLDFGEEIPYESLVTVIKNADYRIKDISLDDPVLYTKFCMSDNTEHELVAAEDSKADTVSADKAYNQLALRNVLAGRIAAFQYNENFKSEYDKARYSGYESEYPVVNTADPTATKKIKSLVSEFRLGDALGTSTELKLQENQVIQFRVPNFKTTYTYPAYVNYFIKLDQDTNAEDKPIAATFKPLGIFMSEIQSGTTTYWDAFVNNSVSKANINSRMEELTFDTEDKFKAALDSKVAIFSKAGGTYSLATIEYYKGNKSAKYYHLRLTDNIFTLFNNWIKTLTVNGQSLGSIYRSIGLQTKGTFGKLVDVDLFKYMIAYKFGSSVDNKEVLNNFYVPATHSSTTAEHTADGLGRDSNFTHIPKDSEYQLGETEYLLINYTDSKTNEAGQETKTVVNKYWGPGTIIRPNFAITDSSLYHTNHSYSKRDGFYFQENRTLEGMFTLGTNEQIEIRDVVKVDLDDSIAYLYWELNSDDPDIERNEFKFTENYGDGENNAYTLREGEHLYFTNSKKQNLVFYGAGTIVVKHANTPSLYKYARNGEVSEEDIMTEGLAANIPWNLFDLSGDQYLEIIENQYVSLTAGDTIKMISNNNSLSGIIPLDTKGYNNWEPIKGAKYRFAEDDFDTELPLLSVGTISWEARTRLDFNMSRDQAQELNKGDYITVKYTDNSEPVVLAATTSPTLVPLCVNSNFTCQAAIDTVDVSAVDFRIKVSKRITPQIGTSDGSLVLNNYINGDARYTKFDFENMTQVSGRKAFDLNINIPSGAFGLMMIYYIPPEDETSRAKAGAKIKTNITGSVSGLRKFNKNDSIAQEKELSAGLNIFELVQGSDGKKITSISVFADTDYKSSVIFGNVDLVDGINPKLDYRLTDRGTYTNTLDQLLADIKDLGIADDFYYNNPVQGVNDIDLNPYVDADLLSSPTAWYDPNNVNRKFVITEIDADYLSTGITLSKASRV